MIEDWKIEIAYDGTISNIWNAIIEGHSDGKYVVKNDVWNQDIEANSYVEFGISGNAEFKNYPTEYRMMNVIKSNSKEDYLVDYRVTNDWTEGFTGIISISNNSIEEIEDWILEFDGENEISTIWNGAIVSHERDHYIVKNLGYNANIKAGETVSFGFNVNRKNSINGFSNFKLMSYSEYIEEILEDEKESLIDIGEMYHKEPEDADIVFDKESGISYVKNQLLVSAYMGTPKEAIEEIAIEVGASIVGYLEITCDYQFEFLDNKSIEDLSSLAEYIEGYPYISGVFLNTASEISISSTDDELYKDNCICTIEEVDANSDGEKDFEYTKLRASAVENDDWNLEAMNVNAAYSELSNIKSVRVGIIDNYFEENRIDGELKFEHIFNNPSLDRTDFDYEHGTHVSGIIAAERNNQKGIAGVASKVKLYAYSVMKSTSKKYTDIMNDKIAYANLICNHVKVINVSMGYADEGMIYAASNDYSEYGINARKKVEEDAKIMAEFFSKMVGAGYDFLIVTSAGNSDDKEFVKDNNIDVFYGYRLKQNTDVEPFYNKPLNSKYDYYLNAIEEDNLINRIIVVGSIDDSNEFSDFSKNGDRVNVCAPGRDVLSTIPIDMDYSSVALSGDNLIGYGVKYGTSMAAPHITGLAAMLFQANPYMTAITAKAIICDKNNALKDDVYDDLGKLHHIPDALECVKTAKNSSKTELSDLEYPSGILTGKVNVASAKISAIRTDTGESNLNKVNKYSYLIISSETGEFLENLPMGTYDLLVTADGYLPNSIRNVEIKPDETKVINIDLVKWISSSIGNYIEGMVIDAITGKEVDNAIVRVRKDWNNKSGEYSKTFTKNIRLALTDLDGTFSISAPMGNYTIEIEKDGYIVGYYNTISTKFDSSILEGYTAFPLSPVLPENEYRIVLTWNGVPRDLDSHLTYHTAGGRDMHVYYSNKTGYINGKEVAHLDLDNTWGYGPETVTITLDEKYVNNGVFMYSVHNYSNELCLGDSNAIVRVYKGNELLTDNTFYVPTTIRNDNVWYVFDITKDGVKTRNGSYTSTAYNVQ